MRTQSHPYLDGVPCDKDGYDLPHDAPPPTINSDDANNNFEPFNSRAEFELADFLYRREQMSGKKIDELMDIWAAFQHSDELDDSRPPFANSKDLYDTIDAIETGDVAWQSFSVQYDGELPEGLTPPTWKTSKFEVWFRDPLTVLEGQLGNRDFNSELDYSPKRIYGKNGKRQYSDFMSGNWAWDQADVIAEDPETHGSMFIPVILGSDKTTVSVATGQNEYYPLYTSIGNAQNQVRRAHRNALSLVGFLAIPKTDKQFHDDVEFRKFRRQLFHASLARILSSLRPWTTKPRITRCADGHFRRAIYGLGPYIADYPEQVLLACIVSGWCAKCTALPTDLDDDPVAVPRSHEHTRLLCEAFEDRLKTLWEGYGIVGDLIPFTSQFPRADIHELLAPDLLHQIIKGTFKDHIVSWVTEYLELVHPAAQAKRILADIDRRIAAAPSFPALRRFPEGRGFKQWTGDDSKALMKVYLPAIAGHVPPQMVRAVSAFLEFCYLVRRSQIDEDTLLAIDAAVERFHREREVFREYGIREDFSLPRQHSLVHYRRLIQQFGAPNGLCSSITESKHIKAVKEPWRRSSRNQPLGQMLLTNQRLDKLAAARIDFIARGILDGPCLAAGVVLPPRPPDDEGADEEDDPGMTSLGDVKLAKYPGKFSITYYAPKLTKPNPTAKNYPKTLSALSTYLRQPQLSEYIRRYLYDQLHPESEEFGMDVDLDSCPEVSPNLRITVVHSAVSTYHAPSDLSGIGGMHRERIRAAPSWQRGPGRFDCVFIDKDPDLDGFRGLHVARVNLFFSFKFDGITYPCALVQWFSTYGDAPCEDTGLWMVEPDCDTRGRRVVSVIHIDSILRDSLNAFKLFYVNKLFRIILSLDKFTILKVRKYKQKGEKIEKAQAKVTEESQIRGSRKTEPTIDPELSSSTTTLRQIPNPFVALQDINPLRWPQDLTREIFSPLADQPLPRKYMTLSKGTPPVYTSFIVDRLRTAQDIGDKREILDLIPDLLQRTVRRLCKLKRIYYSNSDLLRVADSEWQIVTCITGAVVDGIPTYYYTDAHHRHAARAGKDLDDLEEVDELEPPYTEQDADHIDIYDFAVLLMMAQDQMSSKVPVDWNDGNYTVHIMYPTAELTQLIVITAHIPHETALAIQEGHPTMKMVKATRDIVDIDIQSDNDLLGDSDFFKVLGGMIEQGIKVANLTPYSSMSKLCSEVRKSTYISTDSALSRTSGLRPQRPWLHWQDSKEGIKSILLSQISPRISDSYVPPLPFSSISTQTPLIASTSSRLALIMTEYDFSPEAYQAHLANMHRISKWVDRTEDHRPEFVDAAAALMTEQRKSRRRSDSFNGRRHEPPPPLPLPPHGPQPYNHNPGYAMGMGMAMGMNPYPSPPPSSGPFDMNFAYANGPGSPGPMSPHMHMHASGPSSRHPQFMMMSPPPSPPYHDSRSRRSRSSSFSLSLPPGHAAAFYPFVGMGAQPGYAAVPPPGYVVLPPTPSRRRRTHRSRESASTSRGSFDAQKDMIWALSLTLATTPMRAAVTLQTAHSHAYSTWHDGRAKDNVFAL
ncbi:hypothetical protein D9615_010296 [Tricholomella constricta]|uniref:Uncharacterized protein n=1 Tax=Tricholomella constricta TaxID=117010 RepID=A0A8H5GPQ5_9AGAR|nr:hypothetical protein D9615_010296 [Tricholomella constricta]